MKIRMAIATLLVLLIQASFSIARETQVYEGDLELRSGETLVIEDKYLLLHGDIQMEGDSRLEIRNCYVIFSASSPSVFGTTAYVHLEGSSRLELVDSHLSVDAYGDRIWFELDDASVLEMTNTEASNTKVFVDDRSTLRIQGGRISEVSPRHSSTTVLQDCSIGWALSLEFVDGDTIELADLAPGVIDSWQLPRRSPSGPPRPSIGMANCDVGGWSVSSADSTVLLTDCTIVRLGLYWSDPLGAIAGLAPGHFSSWRSSVELGAVGDVYVGLFDTTVTENISLGILRGSEDLTIRDSNVSLQVWNFTGNLTIRNTLIQTFTIGTSDFALDASGSTLERGFNLRNSDLALNGSFSLASGAAFHAWEDSTCTRVFRVQVVDEHGQGVAGARVDIMDEWGTTVGYPCDESGVAVVRALFNDTNRRNLIQFTAVVRGRSVGSASVGVLSPQEVTIIVEQ